MTQQPNKQPLGSLIDWTDDELDQLVAITEADLKAAAALWRNDTPKPYAELLEAKVEESTR